MRKRRRRAKRRGARPQGNDHAIALTGKLVGAATIVSAVFAVSLFWTTNDLSGEKIGRTVDRTAVGIARQAQYALTRLTEGDQPAPPQEG